MKVVYKYKLEDGTNILTLPYGAELLKVDIQNDSPILWALIDTGEEDQERIVKIVGDGHPMRKDVRLSYINTFFVDGGAFVFHAFELLH